MHTIVVLDGQTLNPGDLSWNWLSQYGEYRVYPRTEPDMIRRHIGDADIIFTNKTVLTAEILEDCPQLRYIGLLSTGHNSVDNAAARSLGIAVTSVPAYATYAVAQLTFSLILELCNHVGLHADDVAHGGWVQSHDFCYWLTDQIELRGKTLGIVGLGRIGSAVSEIARAFGMKIIYTSHSPKSTDDTIRFMSLDELLQESNIVTLHCPLTEETACLINERRIRLMKPGAILINTARGPVVDESAVADALREGRLGGYGADVVETEPMVPDSPLLRAPNCIVTPHIAWASGEARKRLISVAEANLKAFLEGREENRII